MGHGQGKDKVGRGQDLGQGWYRGRTGKVMAGEGKGRTCARWGRTYGSAVQDSSRQDRGTAVQGRTEQGPDSEGQGQIGKDRGKAE